MEKSFTIIEVTTAVFLITVGIGGVFAIMQQTTAFFPLVSSKLVAAYLAQEGIEIVRNIRDSNWLEQRTNPAIPWDDGLAATSDYRLDYQSLNFPDTTCTLGAGNYLKLDGGFYNCRTGPETKFSRRIRIFDKTAEMMKVEVRVEWTERGRTHTVTAQENLYKWR